MSKRVSTIEIDTGTQIEKYEYISEDIDTYIVSSTDIDLSQEGFVLKQRECSPISSTIEKKCKLVKKEDVIRYYDDWEAPHSYFCGIECSYKEMDGFIRIVPFKEPQRLMDEFTYEEFLLDHGGEFPPTKLSHYYKDIPYDDVRFQRDVITKYHSDYITNPHGITKETDGEERKQLIIEHLIKKLNKIETKGSERLSALLFGSYGYRIPDKLYVTDLDSVFDKVLPRAYELNSADGPRAGSRFLSELMDAIQYGFPHISHKDRFVSDMLWFEDGRIVYPSEDYAFFMHMQLLLKLMDKHKNQEYPYILMHYLDLKQVHYWLLDHEYRKYLTRHNPVYWHKKIVCDDLGDYVRNAVKELAYFKQIRV